MIYIVSESHTSQVEADSPEEAVKIWDTYRESDEYMSDQWDTMYARYVDYSVEVFDANGREV